MSDEIKTAEELARFLTGLHPVHVDLSWSADIIDKKYLPPNVTAVECWEHVWGSQDWKEVRKCFIERTGE